MQAKPPSNSYFTIHTNTRDEALYSIAALAATTELHVQSNKRVNYSSYSTSAYLKSKQLASII